MLAFGSVSADLQPIIIAEVRGAKVQEIVWQDKTTKATNKMDKYLVAGEFADGTQVALSQIGRDYKGQYPFLKGQRYVFSIKSFEHEKDALIATFADCMPFAEPEAAALSVPTVPAVKPAPAAASK